LVKNQLDDRRIYCVLSSIFTVFNACSFILRKLLFVFGYYSVMLRRLQKKYEVFSDLANDLGESGRIYFTSLFIGFVARATVVPPLHGD